MSETTCSTVNEVLKQKEGKSLKELWGQFLNALEKRLGFGAKVELEYGVKTERPMPWGDKLKRFQEIVAHMDEADFERLPTVKDDDDQSLVELARLNERPDMVRAAQAWATRSL